MGFDGVCIRTLSAQPYYRVQRCKNPNRRRNVRQRTLTWPLLRRKSWFRHHKTLLTFEVKGEVSGIFVLCVTLWMVESWWGYGGVSRGRRCIRATQSLASDHFRLLGARSPNDPHLLSVKRMSDWDTQLLLIGIRVDYSPCKVKPYPFHTAKKSECFGGYWTRGHRVAKISYGHTSFLTDRIC